MIEFFSHIMEHYMILAGLIIAALALSRRLIAALATSLFSTITIRGKLKDWYYEREHRLLLSGMFHNFTSDDSRTLKYKFKDLEGIIFGIKTPSDAKLEIFKIIEEKCRSTGRTDFKFYQAFYARATGTIELAELKLLKFEP
jgi:hypothetical protein